MAHACAEESRRENAREKARERIRIRYFLSQMSGSAKKLTLSTLLFFCTQQTKPSAVKWRASQVRHYDLLEELYGSHRATGLVECIPRQIHQAMDRGNVKFI
ncbi:hypothetical protein GmHk_14G040322 [Glycine max]|uniref:Uncharacterized protein n=1 Tax=Glycine soja TaxID=3848 RepID=A0A445H2N0_GLYSO|nr:hypothetical protein GmHk_14G040322 [Glycine max]RZB67867.1 hypothetical protein D0Y65_037943 [Glycine soja]